MRDILSELRKKSSKPSAERQEEGPWQQNSSAALKIPKKKIQRTKNEPRKQ